MKLILSLIIFTVFISVSSGTDYIKDPLNTEDANQKEAITLSKQRLEIEGSELKLLSIYLRKSDVEYNYLVYFARIINNTFTIHSVNVYCSRQSYWTADVYSSTEEKMVSVSFHKPLYIIIQNLVQDYYEKKNLHLKHLAIICSCGHLHIIKTVLREQYPIEIIVVEEETKKKFVIGTVFNID